MSETSHARRADIPHDAEPSPAPVARPSSVRPTPNSVTRFACRALRAELVQFANNTPIPPAVPDPAAVHQLRITARRIRVWLRTFGFMLPPTEAERLSAELRWFARMLGAVRDLDVYMERLPTYIAAARGIAPEDLGGYELDLRRARTAARAALAEVLADPRFPALGNDLEAVAAGLARGAARVTVEQDLGRFAARRLRKGVKRLRKHGRAVPADAPAKALHKLRIEAKRLRYELEFFASAYPRLAASARAVKAIQDLLGEFQDACVASENLECYALGTPNGAPVAAGLGSEHLLDRRQAFALGRLMQAQLERAADVRKRFPVEWRSFAKGLKGVKRELRSIA